MSDAQESFVMLYAVEKGVNVLKKCRSRMRAVTPRVCKGLLA